MDGGRVHLRNKNSSKKIKGDRGEFTLTSQRGLFLEYVTVDCIFFIFLNYFDILILK